MILEDEVNFWRRYSPKTHAVSEGGATIGGPHTLIGEGVDVPHQLVHDLRELDGMG